MPRITNIKIRRGSEQEWNFLNPILDVGEPGYDTTNNILKIGDGFKNWKELGVQSIYSPLRLNSDGDFLSSVSVKSIEIDFTLSGSTEIFTVPLNYMFFINSIEILTTEINTPGEPPSIKLGNEINDMYYYQETYTHSNSLGYRHIIEDPQNAIFEETLLKATICNPSTAIVHKGYIIINGFLFNYNNV